jgi:phosphoglycolate phosphatase
MKSIQCVLFDLDGTLLDTSMDFAYALNQTLLNSGKPTLPYNLIRQTVSSGGLAMTQLAFPELEGDALLAKRDEFIHIYHENIALHTQLFPTLEAGLGILEKSNIPWGIVTNKPGYLTEKLLENLPFTLKPQTLVCGDTLSVRKPHPEPMQLAAEQCGVAPENCLYLGDHPRDIEAGQNAQMQTGAALFGFLPPEKETLDTLQQADWQFHTPYEITHFLQQLPQVQP